MDGSWLLQLADGQRWNFSAEATLHPWLEEFARSLTLEKSSDDQGAHLTFRKGGSAPTSDRACHLGPLIIRTYDDSPDVIAEFRGRRGRRRDIACMWHALSPIYQGAIRRHGFPFHAGLIEIDGRGVLLAGSSGRGKSTLCRRLSSSYPVLCDEETLIVRDTRGRYWTHPFPTWSRLLSQGYGERWDVQKAVPLSHILFIIPAESDETTTLGQGRATMLITRAALEKSLRSWCWGVEQGEGRAMKNRIFENACLLAGSIPASLFSVSLTGRIERQLEKVIGC